MTKPKGKRNRAIIAILLPAIIFLWIIGWSLYWIGHQKESREPRTPPAHREEDHVRLEVIALEEPLEASS